MTYLLVPIDFEEVKKLKLDDLIRLQGLQGSKSRPSRENNFLKMNIELTELWLSNSEHEWNLALKKYWELVKPENVALEEKLERLDPNDIRTMSAEEFYNFLLDEYFVWKYTAKNRLATTRMSLQRYLAENRLSDLDRIKRELFEFEMEDIKSGLEIASTIHGLGIAGASGLLALLFPRNFGTVDQFVVRDLLSIKDINQKDALIKMNPNNIRLNDGVELIGIMKERANELNRSNNTDKWTPRHIDKVLWAYRS